MRYILDTHVLVWWLYNVPRISAPATRLLNDRENEILVSAVSGFEVANKFRLGKWQEIAALATSFDAIVESQGFTTLPVTISHASRAGLLAGDHRDPFDRIIAAQAILENVPVLSSDGALKALGAEVVWG